jgi:hypothetical protein
LETKSKLKRVSEAHCEGVKGSSSVKFEQDLIIPQNILSSSEKYCRVVQIAYELKIIGVTRGLHQDVEISIPITIGSIPINFAIASSVPESKLDLRKFFPN